ncbi:hypothetical protein Tco_0813786 [Tanacetum coccineum]
MATTGGGGGRGIFSSGGEALHLGPERARVFADLSAEQKDMYKADIRATNILLQEHEVHANEKQNDDGTAQNFLKRKEQCYGSRRQSCGSKMPEDTMRIIKEDHFRGTMQEEMCSWECWRSKQRLLDEEQLLFLAGEQVTNFDDDVDDPNEKDLALNVDHIFEADQCDAFDSDVDDAPPQ